MAGIRHRLVLGGARSGKSRHAQALAEATGPQRTYLATAEARDEEMAARIAQHQAERSEGWQTLEAPFDMPEALGTVAESDVVLVDCLTLWLTNVMLGDRDVDTETEALVVTLVAARQPVILVSNEVGLGLVPETPLGRAFRDAQGRLNQRMAEVVAEVRFVAAGLPLVLKG